MKGTVDSKEITVTTKVFTLELPEDEFNALYKLVQRAASRSYGSTDSTLLRKLRRDMDALASDNEESEEAEEELEID